MKTDPEQNQSGSLRDRIKIKEVLRLHTYGLHSTLEDQKILSLRIDSQLFHLPPPPAPPGGGGGGVLEENAQLIRERSSRKCSGLNER